jgi:glycosyltransferase involved in cell wall biosynthesis
LRGDLLREGIAWNPLVYHKRPLPFATYFDIASGIRTAAVLGVQLGVRAFHGRGTVPGVMAYFASRLTRRRFFYDSDGPLSQEYVDAGIWRAGSLAHQTTRWLEARCLRRADAVAVLTERRKAEVQPLTRHEVTVLPCAVDINRFAHGPGVNRDFRRELALTGRLLVYAGKAGGWYLTDRMFDFAAAFRDAAGDVSVLVLTPEDPEPFLRTAADRGLRCVARRAGPEEVPAYLAAADAGLSFRIDAPSQTACSPIKNGEYLASGLPVVTSAGVGDYSDLIAAERVGVVVSSLTADGLRASARQLLDLLKDPKLRERCQSTARRAVSLDDVVVPRYRLIYENLLGGPAGG